MKVFLLFILIFSVNVSAEVIQLISTTPNEVKRGDIVVFQVKSTHSLDNLKKYENKRIGELVYLLSVYNKDQDIFAEGVISERGLKEKLKPLDDEFKVYNLNYIPTEQKRIRDFIVIEGPKLKSKEYYKLYALFIILILIYPLYLLLKIFQKKKKIRKKYKSKQRELEIILDTYKTRGDLEKIYSTRNLISEYFDFNTNKLDEFIRTINLYQYQKEINSDEFNLILKKYSEFKKTVRKKSGV